MRMSARDGKRKISPDIAGGMSWRQREGKEAKKGELPTVEVRGETMLVRRRAPLNCTRDRRARLVISFSLPRGQQWH